MTQIWPKINFKYFYKFFAFCKFYLLMWNNKIHKMYVCLPVCMINTFSSNNYAFEGWNTIQNVFFMIIAHKLEIYTMTIKIMK